MIDTQQSNTAMRLHFVKDFFDLIFPRTCDLCGRSLFEHEKCLCRICIGLLPKANYHLRPTNNDLSQKVMGLTEVGRVLSFLRFTKFGKSQTILHQLKYRNRPALATELGELYSQILKIQEINDWDYLVPVPLHPLKKRRRGYNQSEEFAKGLTKNLNATLLLALERTKFTETQTKKTRLQRLQNVSSVFSIIETVNVYNSSLLLVDDVMTTGATLSECANVLLAAGAKKVDLVTIAAGN